MAKVIASLIACLSLLSVPAAGEVRKALGDKVTSHEVAPGEALVVARFFATEMSGDNWVRWHRIDESSAAAGSGTIVNLTEDGFEAKYSQTIFGGKTNERVLRAIPIKPGRYVMASRNANSNWTDSFCFGAPSFTIKAGEVLYLGDYEVFMLVKMWDGKRRNALRYSINMEEARSTLAARFPNLAPSMKPWRPINGAEFDCAGDEFFRYDLPEADR